LSSVQRTIDQLLSDCPFERGAWLTVGFGAGIAAWLVLPGPWQWGAVLALCAAAVALAPIVAPRDRFGHLHQAWIAMALMSAAGCSTIWVKSALVGLPPIPAPLTTPMAATILERQDEPGGGASRLVLAARLAGQDRAVRLRVMVPEPLDRPDLVPGAVITARVRLQPPEPPLLPGAHDFAFDAWFAGIAATGSLAGPVTVMRGGAGARALARLHADLRDRVLAHLGGSAGAIAATLASGDRGAIARGDADAMRDAGFAHLLSISGLHVSAVIAAVWCVVFYGLGLVPLIALRVRLPLVASLCGAAAGIGYCLVTGSQVPTMRAAAGAVLVLGALALGRDPLSMRLLALAALVILLFWPEALAGAAFQMSFGAVIAVIALHNARWARDLVAHRPQQGWADRLLRRTLLLLVGGLLIQFALLPVALFHFHRAGVYGALANMLAIPLVTLVTMPALGLALLLDAIGLGAPAWWLCGRSIEMVLAIAHATATMPGAVTVLPAMAGWTYALWVAGALWLALWSGRLRLWGLVPVVLALAWWGMTPAPDVLVSGDGRHIGITGLGPDLVVMNPGEGGFARDTLLEMAGMQGQPRPIEAWPGAHCGIDFCALALDRCGAHWVLLIERSRRRVSDEALASACAHSDIVIAARVLPGSCHPRRLLVDGAVLARSGGMAIDLGHGRVTTVAGSGAHPWRVQPPVGPNLATSS
jgi:competence protein ComEC